MTQAAKMEVQKVERIQTGLTPNYLPNWTLAQALKEAVQNIAYGVVKSGKESKIYYDSKAKVHVIRDFYTGLEKKHLYIGESGQRDDSEGLGNFGEGWKIFLLIMARNNIFHEVQTVGFTFYGTLETTEHDTKVLIINVIENDNTKGTKVSVDLPWEDVEKATRSFAILNGIAREHINVDCIIPNRSGELWVSGVRIEDKENINPLNLLFSYNLRHRDLINRDRSHPNTELAYSEIRQLIGRIEDEEIIRGYILLALDKAQNQDILRGPYFIGSGGAIAKKWLDVLAELHACEPKQLVIPSSNPAVNDEAKHQGFVLLDTPSQWAFELEYIGVKKADLILEDRYDVVETSYYGSRDKGKTPLAKAKLKVKKALGLNSVDELPEIRYVSEIRRPMNETQEIFCQYDKSTDLIYIDVKILEDEALVTKELLREGIRRKYGATSIFDFKDIYEKITLRLL